MRYFAYIQGGDSFDLTGLVFQSEEEIRDAVIVDYADDYNNPFPIGLSSSHSELDVYSDTKIEDVLNILVQNIDGGYDGHWIELIIENNTIKEK